MISLHFSHIIQICKVYFWQIWLHSEELILNNWNHDFEVFCGLNCLLVFLLLTNILKVYSLVCFLLDTNIFSLIVWNFFFTIKSHSWVAPGESFTLVSKLMNIFAHFILDVYSIHKMLGYGDWEVLSEIYWQNRESKVWCWNLRILWHFIWKFKVLPKRLIFFVKSNSFSYNM